jgi:hypothetical protein
MAAKGPTPRCEARRFPWFLRRKPTRLYLSGHWAIWSTSTAHLAAVSPMMYGIALAIAWQNRFRFIGSPNSWATTR